jgi:outer membrane scaffolding protein for murein synthesis (MipA/OmpV family)
MTQRSLFIRYAAALATSLLALSAVHAQAFDAVRLYGAAPGKDGGVAGLAVIAGTEYMGSDERRTLALPILDYQWADGWFAGVSNGIGYNFSSSPGMQYGLRLTADLGRKESRSTALRGMGDIDASAEGGAFFNCELASGFSFTSSLRYGAGNDGKGLLLDIGAAYSALIAQQWRFSVGTALTAANAEYMQSYFGVSATQAAASGYRSFAPKAGVRDVRTSVALSYQISRDISLTGALTATTLVGDAADSPLTRKKSSVNGFAAVSYAF